MLRQPKWDPMLELDLRSKSAPTQTSEVAVRHLDPPTVSAVSSLLGHPSCFDLSDVDEIRELTRRLMYQIFSHPTTTMWFLLLVPVEASAVPFISESHYIRVVQMTSADDHGIAEIPTARVTPAAVSDSRVFPICEPWNSMIA